VGTLSAPLFGWDELKFHELAGQIDAIYHSGAWVNFIYPYQLLKPTNVQGTIEILRFACCAKLKPVHHISTFSVFSKTAFTQFEKIDELTPLHIAPLLLDGYSQSKWVAERLIMEAQTRGIPATIYRLGHITGHSQQGVCHTSDLLWNQIKSCIQLQIAPILTHAIDITPVDFVSQAIVNLSKKTAYGGKTFHLISKDLITWNELFDHVRTLGYHLELRTWESWRYELLARTQNDPQNALYPFLSLFKKEEESVDYIEPQFNSEQTHAELNNIVCHPPNLALFERYFTYFINCGFLESSQNFTYSNLKVNIM
jgi:thioester reductase-like protein